MPLRTFKCELCGYIRETFKPAPNCNHNQEEEGSPIPLTPMVSVLEAPATKFMEKIDPDKGKSRIVGQEKMLKERARKYNRDNELDDYIQNNDKKMARENNWLKSDGTKRKKVDDI